MVIIKDTYRAFAILALLGLCGAALFMQTVTYAQSSGLGITPRKEVSIAPNETKVVTVSVQNLNQKSPLTTKVSIEDFVAADKSGAAQIRSQTTDEPAAWSLKSFATFPDTVTIGPGQIAQVPVTITIPQKQGAGSYYSAVRFESTSTAENGVAVNASAATLLFVTVPGKAVERMNLQQFGVYVPQKNTDDSQGSVDGVFSSLFIMSEPQVLAYELQNQGSVAENPASTIQIKNIFGKQVRLIKNANPKDSIALIGQTRHFESCIATVTRQIRDSGSNIPVATCTSPKLLPGMYTAELTVHYGINGSDSKEIRASTVFWYMPVWFIAVCAAFLAVIAYIMYKTYRVLLPKYTRKRAIKASDKQK